MAAGKSKDGEAGGPKSGLRSIINLQAFKQHSHDNSTLNIGSEGLENGAT